MELWECASSYLLLAILLVLCHLTSLFPKYVPSSFILFKMGVQVCVSRYSRGLQVKVCDHTYTHLYPIP